MRPLPSWIGAPTSSTTPDGQSAPSAGDRSTRVTRTYTRMATSSTSCVRLMFKTLFRSPPDASSAHPSAHGRLRTLGLPYWRGVGQRVQPSLRRTRALSPLLQPPHEAFGREARGRGLAGSQLQHRHRRVGLRQPGDRLHGDAEQGGDLVHGQVDRRQDFLGDRLPWSGRRLSALLALTPGQRVVFTPTETPRGPRAVEVQVIARARAVERSTVDSLRRRSLRAAR